MEQIKWIERKFSFGYDKGYAPLFIERLKATVPRLEELLTGIDESDASLRQDNKWSIKEHAGHLFDLEYLGDGRIDDFMSGLSPLRAADMTNKVTYEANHNEQIIPVILSQFREARNKFIQRLESLDDKYFEIQSLHPRLQQMITLTDLLFFIGEHDNNHLTTIARLSRR